jgi:beta-alanine degradation protein BauB
MKMERLAVIGAVGALALGAAAALAQDPVKIQPENHKVVFEDEHVRVLDVTFGPGTTLKKHSHPDHVIYFLEGARTKQTDDAGKVSDVEGKKGDARWVAATTHAVENVGKTTAHVIVVEMKDKK